MPKPSHFYLALTSGSDTTTHYKTARAGGVARARVAVTPAYLPRESAGGKYWFSYAIIIGNRGECPFQLVERRWVITDDNNQTREVSGAGVVGKQPLLKPGEAFRYVSYVDFPTPTGFMRGEYTLRLPNNDTFTAIINMFSLSAVQSH